MNEGRSAGAPFVVFQPGMRSQRVGGALRAVSNVRRDARRSTSSHTFRAWVGSPARSRAMRSKSAGVRPRPCNTWLLAESLAALSRFGLEWIRSSSPATATNVVSRAALRPEQAAAKAMMATSSAARIGRGRLLGTWEPVKLIPPQPLVPRRP